jgi:hypothetical protein
VSPTHALRSIAARSLLPSGEAGMEAASSADGARLPAFLASHDRLLCFGENHTSNGQVVSPFRPRTQTQRVLNTAFHVVEARPRAPE